MDGVLDLWEGEYTYRCILTNDCLLYTSGWCGTDELYVKYHDEEWGKPVTDDKTLSEFLVLESAQAGLSWICLLYTSTCKTAFFIFSPPEEPSLIKTHLPE